MAENQVHTVAEVAELTGFSRQTMTRMFKRERGGLILGRPEPMHNRPYRILRIPCAVYERVVTRSPVSARFTAHHIIAMFEFSLDREEVKLVEEKHSRIVRSHQIGLDGLRLCTRR